MRGYCTSSLWSLLLLLLDACCLLTTPVSARLEEVPKFNARDACHGGTNIATRQGYLFGPSYADAEIKQLTAGAGLHRCSWTIDTNSSAKVVRLVSQYFSLDDHCVQSKLHVHDGDSREAPLLATLCGSDVPAELTTSAGALHLELEFRAIHVGEGFMFYFEHAYRPVECAAELVSCRNGYRCASTEQLCDGHDDCGDGTDEEECPVSAVNGTTVFQPAVSVVSGTLRGQGRRLLSELSHLPAKSITWHTSQSAQWSLAPYVVKAGGYCQSSLTFLRSPSPGTHHNQEIFQERMAACAPALFQMMEEAPTKHTMELVVRVRDEGQREKAVQVAVLPFLCAHFKEDKNYLYQVFEEGTSITEKLAELPSTPTIIALVYLNWSLVLYDVSLRCPQNDVSDPCRPCLRASCGSAPSDTDRIVGGTEASMDRWPWIAQLRAPRDEPNGYRCTATLIASKWLLSAAHCFKISLKPDRWVVNLRRHGIILQEDETVVRYVHRIIIHPGYNGFKPWNHTTPWLWRKEHDLALIELNAPVLESESVQPVCLPVDTDYWPAKGTLCRVAGWGVTLDPTQSRHFLREVALPVVDRKQCQAWFADREIGQTQLCAGYERGARDACTGDSGGPLVTRNGSQWILVGVVSTGVGCAKPRQPGIYTAVAPYLSWISEETGL
ncbi:enteropeptidase [Rhipicephalus microplus]|uniref:enteropeptidase n=1 Tax=Rhipicephalus microplus TaxID=6941 RepID=UPI003F6A690A